MEYLVLVPQMFAAYLLKERVTGMIVDQEVQALELGDRPMEIRGRDVPAIRLSRPVAIRRCGIGAGLAPNRNSAYSLPARDATIPAIFDQISGVARRP